MAKKEFMIFLATYASNKMTEAQNLCIRSALKMGVDQTEAIETHGVRNGPLRWSRQDLDNSFCVGNEYILSRERGAGYWLWKPYIIFETISRLLRVRPNENDILIYADAGVEFIAPVQEIISRMDEDIFFFTNGFPHVEWCKADVMQTILNLRAPIQETDCGVFIDGSEYDAIRHLKQVQASVIFFKVNQKTRDFVKEWLLWCQMPGFIDDSPSKTPNYPTFAEHRHDQAILTCLQIKYGYKLHFWPTNYSEHIRHTARPEDNYPALFNHHRKRNHEWKQFA